MKKLYLLYALFISSFLHSNIFAQVTAVLEGVEQPTAVLLEGNDLYYGEFQGSYYKYDITTNDAPTVIFSSTGIYRTVKSGNFIYVTECYSGLISKIDISETMPQPITVLINLNFPAGLAIKDNYLYFAEFVNASTGGRISKIDLNVADPQKTVIASGLFNPKGVGIIGSNLYFSDFSAGTISKIDLSVANSAPSIIVSGLLSPTEIIVNGNHLIVSVFSGDKVIDVDVSTNIPVVTDVVNNIINPTGLFLSGEDLYISEFGANRIVKYTSPVFGVAENQIGNSKLVLSPNPAVDFVAVKGLSNVSKYSIYNNHGREVSAGDVSNNQKLSVGNLQSGLYFIRFENGSALKFIKN